MNEGVVRVGGRAMALGCALGVVCAAGTAGASVIEIAGNLGPGDSYNQVSSWIVLGPDEVSIGNVDQAAPFNAGAEDVYATTVEFAVRRSEGLDGVALSIYSDAGGVPGAALVSTAVASLPTNDGGAVVSADLPFPLLLSGGADYWVVLDAGFDTELSWFWNDMGMMLKAGRSGDPVGPWNLNADAMTPAFRVMGRAVPGPGAAGALALAGLAACRRRRSVG